MQFLDSALLDGESGCEDDLNMKSPLLEQYRSFLKDTVRKRIDFSQTDQSRGVSPPPIEKPFPGEASLIDLSMDESWKGIPRSGSCGGDKTPQES